MKQKEPKELMLENAIEAVSEAEKNLTIALGNQRDPFKRRRFGSQKCANRVLWATNRLKDAREALERIQNPKPLPR